MSAIQHTRVLCYWSVDWPCHIWQREVGWRNVAFWMHLVVRWSYGLCGGCGPFVLVSAEPRRRIDRWENYLRMNGMFMLLMFHGGSFLELYNIGSLWVSIVLSIPELFLRKSIIYSFCYIEGSSSSPDIELNGRNNMEFKNSTLLSQMHWPGVEPGARPCHPKHGKTQCYRYTINASQMGFIYNI